MDFPSSRPGRFYVGIAGVDVRGEEIQVGCGAMLRPTYAHLMAPYILAFAPAPVGSPHPAPWKNASGGLAIDIVGEIEIPGISDSSLDERLNLARIIIALIRLSAHPDAIAPVVSTIPFAAAAKAPDNTAHFLPLEVEPTHLQLTPKPNRTLSRESLSWVPAAVAKTVVLMDEHPELDMAIVALDRSQFVREPALILISLWAALEAIFSPDKSAELKFRIATRMAYFLETDGSRRFELYNQVRKLYDARSAAAHGSLKQKPQLSLVPTYNLLRRVFIRIIDTNHFPTQAELEQLIFSGS